MKKIVLFIMPLIAMLLGMNACKGNDPVQPAEKKARYTIMVYGNAGGSMDSYIEHLWERTKPLMKSKDVRLGFFYKYGKKVDGAEQKYGAPGDLLEFELTPETNLDSLCYTAATSGWEDFELYDPELLKITIDLMAKEMPAENYIFILNGHAGGWELNEDGEYPAPNKAPKSAITDAFFDGRAIKAKELHDGIKKSGIPVGAVIFDCCLQNSIEYLPELTDVTTYTLGSGHTTHGGDYASLP